MVCSLVMRNMGVNTLWLWMQIMILVLGMKGRCCFGGCLEKERIALLQLKANINHPNGTSLPSWVEEESSNCCQWEGVECNTTTNRVTQLSLNYTRNFKNLGDWYFNASLFLPFEELTTLHLPDNGLAGWVENEGFESLSRLRNLEALDLSDNYFHNSSVLSSLSGLSSLKYLDLSWNQLGVSTHFNSLGRLTGLSNLQVLSLNGNQLNNSVHSFIKLGDFVSLKRLNLGSNQIKSFEPFQGSKMNFTTLFFYLLKPTPPHKYIYNIVFYFLATMKLFKINTGLEGSSVLSNLETLYLHGNHLNNSILPSLRGLSTLKILDLAYNQLKGSIHVKELYTLSNLEELDLSRNEIESFANPEGVRSLEQLKVLYLDDVKLNTSNLLKSLTTLSSLKTLYSEYSEIKGAFTTQGLRNHSNLENLFFGQSSVDMNFLQSIGVWTSLKVLSASSCNLNGTLPTQGWCELKNLQVLDLSGNQLEGILPPCLGNLTSLRVFDLSYNQLTGNTDSSPLIALSSLEYLSLSTNHFQIPTSLRSFANHSSLKVLLCVNNILIAENELNAWAPKFQLNVFTFSSLTKDNFNLVLPSFLYYQYDLRIVDLSHNNLSGTFPNWLLENNTRLEGLLLSDNSLAGPLNLLSHPYPNILKIDISNNKIGGRIPPNLSSIFPNLLILKMSGNAFDGNLIPQDMNAIQYLDLSNNLLSGVMPEYFTKRCPSLVVIILSNNNLSGKISPTVFNVTQLRHLHLDGNSFIGNVPDSLSLMPLRTVNVGQNHFFGELPRWMGNMTYTNDILMSKNHFQDLIPVEFCQLKHLRFLDLSENNLSGSIPSCFNKLSIQHLHLHKNRLEGPMTHAFYNSSSLVTLDLRENYLSGNIPTWIGTLSALSVLLLKDNSFEGKIPSQLCQLKTLTIVDLSQNNLSGSLPSCLGKTIPFEDNGMLSSQILFGVYGSSQASLLSYMKNSMSIQKSHAMRSFQYSTLEDILTGAAEEVEFTTKKRSYSYKGTILSYMSGIDFSCNQLTGEIPPEIGNLSNIHALNLSHNNFTGSIPSTFSNLRQVESLDLSFNNLNGQIPSQLNELNFLGTFSVAHNNLSGRTPDQKAQFGTFEESSYEGNPLLCGPPLHNNCNEIGSPPSMPNASNRQTGEDGFVDMGVFYVWFYLIEVCITRSYYFIVDNVPKLFKFRNIRHS